MATANSVRIPREWREREHDLTVRSRYHGGGAIRGSRVYRAGGTCSCGEKWGLDAGKHNMDRSDIIAMYRVHVEDAWMQEKSA